MDNNPETFCSVQRHFCFDFSFSAIDIKKINYTTKVIVFVQVCKSKLQKKLMKLCDATRVISTVDY